MGDVRAGWWYDVDAIFEAGLSVHALAVRLYLARCANKEGKSWPSITTISAKCGGISRATVVRALRELVDKGWLCRESRYRLGTKEKETSIYSLQYPGLQVGSHRADVGSHRADVGSHRAREGNPLKEISTAGISEPTWGPGDIDRQATWVQAQLKLLGYKLSKDACRSLFNDVSPSDIRQAVINAKELVGRGEILTSPAGFLRHAAAEAASRRACEPKPIIYQPPSAKTKELQTALMQQQRQIQKVG